ncbi:gamma-glutamyl-gamma-aminobutyrate hydrolase family protein [Streptococcus didelphis]|uniref:gamma-glutamyl-gamma-aminobutyrate hydrolase family protein n=1 Tax=Streptococcus didelphis TaxID=102886 RepID=UPI0003745499|nr:gamma-glutamyl-gamma-aminobutyrate hydrolase family protein [Streptococcus didelphis]
MKAPIIGITTNQKHNASPEGLAWIYSPSSFIQAVLKAGGTPLLLPIADEKAADTYVSLIDKLILIGGQNVDPKFYHEEKSIITDDFYLERDIFEMALIKAAIKQGKPILGICRGTQLMNVYLGGSLNQAIENHWQLEPINVVTHQITISPTSVLQPIYGEKTMVNSFHRQSIKELAKDLTVIATDSEDATIEAVVAHTSKLSFLGVQWHPELTQVSREEDIALFRYFINEF